MPKLAVTTASLAQVIADLDGPNLDDPNLDDPRWMAQTVELLDSPDLLAQLSATGTAWLRKGEGMVGVGEIARLDGADFTAAEQWWRELLARIEIQTELPDHPGSGPIAFASFPFDPTNTDQQSVLVVPQFVIGHRGGRSWLTTLSRVGEPAPNLPAPDTEPPTPPQVRLVADSLDYLAWTGIVAEAVTRLTRGELAKVVLARSETLAADSEIDPRWLVKELADAYPTCWTFHVAGMVGASPEMLLRREGGLATSRVLAGTIRRVGDQELDLKLAQALSRSGKNLIEHELAVASVARALEPFCSGMNVPDAPYVLELPNVLHLASDVTAVANPGTTALRLAGELHPSAAVCGTPTAAAYRLIAELENLDRGRYSGPIGWLDAHGDGEFAIALRSGWLHPDRKEITIFAGCGIVAESEPEEEYAETEAKLVPMHQVLGLS
jgi:menaquinone-specific isochorismate synthase